MISEREIISLYWQGLSIASLAKKYAESDENKKTNKRQAQREVCRIIYDSIPKIGDKKRR